MQSLAQGYQANNASLATAQVPQPTVTQELINRLEFLNGDLMQILTSQRNLIDRLHGPRPQSETAGGIKGSNGGILASIDERLNWLGANLRELADNQHTLERLA